MRCPDGGVDTKKVPQLPSKAPFSKRFAEAAGLACESAAARRVARSSDWRQLRCGPSIYNIWNARRRREESRCCGRTEIFRFWLGGLPVPGRKLIKSNYPAAKASFYLTAVINVHPVPKVIQEETHSVIGCCQPFLHPNASAAIPISQSRSIVKALTIHHSDFSGKTSPA